MLIIVSFGIITFIMATNITIEKLDERIYSKLLRAVQAKTVQEYYTVF